MQHSTTADGTAHSWHGVILTTGALGLALAPSRIANAVFMLTAVTVARSTLHGNDHTFAVRGAVILWRRKYWCGAVALHNATAHCYREQRVGPPVHFGQGRV